MIAVRNKFKIRKDEERKKNACAIVNSGLLMWRVYLKGTWEKTCEAVRQFILPRVSEDEIVNLHSGLGGDPAIAMKSSCSRSSAAPTHLLPVAQVRDVAGTARVYRKVPGPVHGNVRFILFPQKIESWKSVAGRGREQSAMSHRMAIGPRISKTT